MKADCKIFKGIEYVRLSELPPVQQDALLKTIDPHLFIKIMIDGVIVSNCLQYKHYAAWFDNVYREQAAQVAGRNAKESPALEINPKLALNKA